MSTGGHIQMAALEPSARPPLTSHRPSRLPLHRSRPFTDKSNMLSPFSSSSMSHTETSHTPAFTDANKGSERLVNGSHFVHKTTQVGLNRMSLQSRQSVADEIPSHRGPQPRRRDAIGVSPAAVTVQHHSVGGGVMNDLRYGGVRETNNPTCGVRMSALPFSDRQRQPSPQSPTSSVKSSSSMTSNRRTTAALLGYAAANDVQPRRAAKPHVSASSHYASTSSVDSTCSEHLAPVTPRRLVRTSASSLAVDNPGNVTDKQRSRSSRNSSMSYLRRKSAVSRDVVASESDEILSSRSDCLEPPTLRHLPAVDYQTHKLRRRSLTSDVVRSTEHQQRPAGTVVEPRRRCYNPWQLSETDVNDLITADSMSTITSIDSSSSLSSGTLTDDADESTGESTTASGMEIRRRDVGLFKTPSNAPPPLYRASIAVDRKTRTKTPSRRASSASSELQSSSSTTSIEGSLRPAEKYSSGIQRNCNFGVTARAPATVGKHIAAPPTQLQKCVSARGAANQPRNRQIPASASPRSDTPASPQCLPSKSITTVAKNAAKHVAHSSPCAVVVGRGQQMAFADGSTAPANVNPALKTTTVNPPSSSSHPDAQTHQNAAVKKAGDVSNSKSSVSHLPVSSSSKVVDEKRVTFQSPPRRGPYTANKDASRDYTHLTGTGAHFRTNVAYKDNTNVTVDQTVVEKSVGSSTTRVVASRDTAKPFTSAVRQIKSPQSETVHVTNISHSTKTIRDTPTPSTRSTRTQTSATIVSRSADSSCSNDSTAVTKRPPPPPSKLRRPGSVSGVTAAIDRGHARTTEQKRPASIDCSVVSSIRQQSVDVCRKKFDSCIDVASRSVSTEQVITTRKPAKGVLNKNDHLTKSYDCITPLSGDSEKQNSDVFCSQMHGSSTSLADIPPRRLVKPYSVINRCSTFVRRITAPKEDRSTSTDSKAELETEHIPAGSRSSLASRSQTRVSELSDLPEVDEFECDPPPTDRLPSDERNLGSYKGQQQSTVERTETLVSALTCPSIPQKPAERYKTEYSTFVSAVPPYNDESTSDNSSSHRDCVYTAIKHDTNDMENSCSSKTQYCTQKIEDLQLVGYVEPANAVRPVTLSAEISNIQNATADNLSSADNYIVTYESDNIVVLDREPVVDCLTPDGDIVSTELCQLLVVPTNSAGPASAEGGLSRTLPLSESGYDTWKSSQGSVAVAAACTGSTCIVAPDHSAERQQRQEEDGTLGDRCLLKTFESQSAPLSSPKNAYTEVCGTGQLDDKNSSALFGGAGNNSFGESTITESGAAAVGEFKYDDVGRGESPSRDDDNGRVAGGSVEDSARQDAQMFVSICSDAVDQVAGGASSPCKSCITNSVISQASRPSLLPPDNAVPGLADASDICFSSQTIPSNDSDVLSTFGTSSHNTAHLERFDEEVHNASSLLPGMDHFCHHVATDINELSDNLAEDVRDDTCLYSAAISTGNAVNSDHFDVGEEFVDVQQLDQHDGIFSEVCLQMKSPWENNEFVIPSSSTAAVSNSALLDPYETICDDLLESIEANISDTETSRHSHASYTASLAAASCSTDVILESDAKTSECPRELTPANDHDTILTKTVAVGSSDVDWQPTYSQISTLNSSGPPLSMTVTVGCLPVMTLRRARTNFSVVYRQTASHSLASQSSTHGGNAEAKISTREVLSHAVSELGTVGCRRALAVLASRLDNHRKRGLAETDVDGCAMPRRSSQSCRPAVDHDPDIDAVSPAVSLPSEDKRVDSTSTVTGDNDAAVARNDVDHSSDLQSNLQSPLNVQGMKSVSAESKLPISTRASSTHSSVSKKPSTFRKLLSSRLANAVRRTQKKYD